MTSDKRVKQINNDNICDKSIRNSKIRENPQSKFTKLLSVWFGIMLFHFLIISTHFVFLQFSFQSLLMLR